MVSSVPTCKNHPREQTRVSCSSCGDPICPRCMRQSAVGQKCPECARPAKSTRARGKPVHYVRAVGGGLCLALVGGFVLVELWTLLRFGGLILSALLGFGVGRAVGWGAQRQTQPPFTAIAVACTVGGLAVAFSVTLGLGHIANPWRLLGYAAAGYGAVRGLRG